VDKLRRRRASTNTGGDGGLSGEACIEEADGNVAFIAKALGDIARALGMTQVKLNPSVRIQAEVT
jgi:hypothetical protein